MPSTPPAPSAVSETAAVRPWLLVGLSVRALAEAAARGGHPVCAVDAFADRDTVAACAGRALPARLGAGWRLRPAAVLAAASALQGRFAPAGFAGIVTGGGCEQRPGLLSALAAIAPVAGSEAAAIRAVREARRWFALLDAIGAPHPPVAFTPPSSQRSWLLKSASGSGGWHIRHWRPELARSHDDYFQRRRPGRPASVLFIANGEQPGVVGWQWQITAGNAAQPWRYGGVLTADDLPAGIKARITDIVERIVARVPLRGLLGLDFLVDGEAFDVLELNPRPTASLALYPQHDLFGAHLAACAGQPGPALLPEPAPARGEAVLYAPQPLAVAADFPWPAWCADIPAAGARFASGEPVCTVTAAGPNSRALRLRLTARLHRLLTTLNEIPPHEPSLPKRQRTVGTPGPSPAG